MESWELYPYYNALSTNEDELDVFDRTIRKKILEEILERMGL